MKDMKTKKCKNPDCGKIFEIVRSNRNNVYCSRSCSATHTNKLKSPMTQETKEKISDSLKKSKDKRIDSIVKVTKGKYKKGFGNIFELSMRTIQKIIKRIGLGCSECGWDKGSCDIHHINGRKIDDCHNHNNLTLLCPNCHRLAHEGKINKNKLKTLNNYFPENWRDYYFG
jgi:predicted HNH restriction endonuclease